MSKKPMLLVGGSGSVGRWTARLLREAHPDLPILIGGRDRGKVEGAAAAVGLAEAVTVDLGADDLGFGDRSVSAVVVFFADQRLAVLRFAPAHGVPHLSISPGLLKWARKSLPTRTVPTRRLSCSAPNGWSARRRCRR